MKLYRLEWLKFDDLQYSIKDIVTFLVSTRAASRCVDNVVDTFIQELKSNKLPRLLIASV